MGSEQLETFLRLLGMGWGWGVASGYPRHALPLPALSQALPESPLVWGQPFTVAFSSFVAFSGMRRKELEGRKELLGRLRASAMTAPGVVAK